MVWLQVFVVLAAIFLGIRMGSIGIGLYGALGIAILTFGFGLPLGALPIDVMLIIMCVIIAAAALQRTGGMDFLVTLAAKIMRKNPKYLNILAPIITWFMTIISGTGFIVFSLLPVIAEIAKESNNRPSRALVASVVSSQFAVSGSPVSAAMAALLFSMESQHVPFDVVLKICLTTSFIAAMIGAFFASRQGSELEDDPVYLQRLQQNLIHKYQEKSVTQSTPAIISILLFIVAVIAIVAFAAHPEWRPGFATNQAMRTSDLIIVIMLSSAALMCILCKISADSIVTSDIFRSGMSSIAVILGIVTLGSTFVGGHMSAIQQMAGNILTQYPMLLALVFFVTCALLYSQGATAQLIVPLAVTLAIPNWAILASFVAVTGVFILPTYPTSLAAMEFDSTGSTRMGKYLFDHPFIIPGITGVIGGVLVGFLIAPMIM